MNHSGVALEEVLRLRGVLRDVCDRFDPLALPVGDAPVAFVAFAEMEKLVAGARIRVAIRVKESEAARRDGERTTEEWMARRTGSSTADAKRDLTTSGQLVGLDGADAAVRQGALSPDQAAAVADAATADPDAEAGLLDCARRQPLSTLRDEARRTKAAADRDPERTHQRIHRNRFLRRWVDGEGAYNAALRVTAIDGAAVDAALNPLIDQLFDQARAQGRHDPPEAYAADALVGLLRHVTTTTTAAPAAAAAAAPDAVLQPAATAGAVVDWELRGTRRRESKIIAVIDAAALQRGRTEGGETCEVAGVGPVPVSAVRALVPDAFLSYVVKDGVDVRTVVHVGRQVTAHQRTALEARGYHCERPGCASRHLLEIDHISGWAITKTTKLDDLAWLCPHDHDLKTRYGFRIEGPPGRRRWLRPDGTLAAGHPDVTPERATVAEGLQLALVGGS